MYGMPRNSDLQLITVKWLGTTLCLVGIALTSFNIYPANIILSLVGSILWTMAGILQRDAPLILVEGVAVFLYSVGFISYVISKLYYYF
jgi:hypothetical protein